MEERNFFGRLSPSPIDAIVRIECGALVGLEEVNSLLPIQIYVFHICRLNKKYICRRVQLLN